MYQGLFLSVFLGVSLHRLFGVPSPVNHVSSCCVSMVRRLLVMAGVMMFGRFPVVSGSMCKMF
jgi:hypothetical protein